MWRLIAFIIIFAVFLAFIVFNLDNKCDVSVGIKNFEGIPVFLTAFSSFVLGMIFAVPFVLSFGRKLKKKAASEYSAHPAVAEEQTVRPKKRWGFRKKNSAEEPAADLLEQSSEDEAPAARNSPKDAEKLERDEAFKLADQIKRENNFNGFF